MTDETTHLHYMEWKIEAVIRQSGYVAPEHAADLMTIVMDGLREDFGGARVWIPSLDKAQRNQAIRSAFNGRNHDEVCRRFRISRPTLWRIIKTSP